MSCSYKIINLLKQTCHNVCIQVGIVLQSHDLGKISYTWAWNIFKSFTETSWNPVSHRVSNYLPASFSIFTTCTHRQKFLMKNFILLVNQFYFIWCFLYVHVCTYACSHMYWFVYVHVGARGRHGVCSSNAFHSSCSSQQGVLMNLVLADLIKIPSQSLRGILSPPPPPDH